MQRQQAIEEAADRLYREAKAAESADRAFPGPGGERSLEGAAEVGYNFAATDRDAATVPIVT